MGLQSKTTDPAPARRRWCGPFLVVAGVAIAAYAVLGYTQAGSFGVAHPERAEYFRAVALRWAIAGFVGVVLAGWGVLSWWGRIRASGATTT
jgi:hypothetical protein